MHSFQYIMDFQLQTTKRQKAWNGFFVCATLVLLRLSKSASKPRFFSNIEPYRNRGFRLCIDGFGFLGNGTALMSGAVNVRPNSTQPQ